MLGYIFSVEILPIASYLNKNAVTGLTERAPSSSLEQNNRIISENKLDLTKIEGLPSLLKTIQDLLGTTLGSVGLAVFVFVSLLSKIPQSTLLQSYIARKHARIKWLSEHSTPDEQYCRGVVNDVKSAMIFEQATGIYAEGVWRKALVDLQDETKMSWDTIKKARRFMELAPDNSIVIRQLSLFDKIDSWFNAAMTWLFIAMATILLISAFVLKPSIETIATAIAVSVLLFACAVGAALQNAPRHAAATIGRKRNSVDMQAAEVQRNR